MHGRPGWQRGKESKAHPYKKKELTTNHATQVPFEVDSDEEFFFFTDEEHISYADRPYEPKIEEETDDEDYVMMMSRWR